MSAELTYEAKKEKLREWMQEYTGQPAAVAFSGGVDSSLLLFMAAEAAAKNNSELIAITADTSLHPSCDRAIAIDVLEQIRKLTGLTKLTHRILELDEFADAGIADNPVDRCYRCKRFIFTTMQKELELLGISGLMEGTNLDDTKTYRPGIRALKELGIRSPLMELGFTKEEVRRLSAEYGLSVAQRPSTPCMATRFPYGTQLTEEGLRSVEAAEAYLKTFGLYNVRVRVHGDLARIEADSGFMQLLLDRRREITENMKQFGYRYITLDLDGFRSGSMDESLKGTTKDKTEMI